MTVERLERLGDSEWVAYAADHISRYTFAREYAVGKKVLDAGTGIGYGAAILAAGGATEVFAVDIDETSVAKAKSLFGRSNLAYHVGDCESLDVVTSPVDLVCNFENIEHLQHPELFLRQVRRVLKSDGVFLCSTPDRTIAPPYLNGKPANPFHVHEWYYEEFAALLDRHFDTVEVLAQVKSHWQVAREEAAEAAVSTILTHSALLRKSPIRLLSKLGSRLGVFTRQPQTWSGAQVRGLAAASPDAYPIVPRLVAEVYGRPWCHVAICRSPRSNAPN